MATTSKYNKSWVMKRAWMIHRSMWQYASDFSMCLKRAWEIHKEDIAEKEKLNAWHSPAEPTTTSKVSEQAAYQSKVRFMESLYANRAYSGD